MASLLLVMLWSPCPGAEPDGGKEILRLALEDTIRVALENSRSVTSAQLDRQDQKLSLEEAEERYRPRARIQASTVARGRADEDTKISFGPTLRVPAGGEFRLDWQQRVGGQGPKRGTTALSFSQPLLKGFGTEVDIAPLIGARMQDRIAMRVFRDRIGRVIGSVIDAYRGVLRAARQNVIARDALERARTQLTVNRALVEAGQMAQQELVQAEAQVADKEYALTETESRLATANSGLVNVLDLRDTARVEPREEPGVTRLRPDLQQSIETAFERRLDYLRAEVGVTLARLDVRVAENDLRWDLSLRAEVARGRTPGRTDYSGELNLTVPLWDRSSRRAWQKARNGLRQAELRLAETRQAIRIEVRRAVHDVAVGLRQIDLARVGRDLAERKLDVERRKLQVGLSSAFQIARFEDDLVRAQNREVDAVVGYRNALTALDRTLGTTLDRWGIDVQRVEQR
ncbi:MAG: TolC family protein [Deltaproteobacteria bacterium]|nr:TolC family protein [Deltaproteobacteria bacterium]